MKNYYEILNITPEEKKLTGDKFREICKKKYRALCLKWHPDKWVNASEEEKKKAEEMFKDIAEANEVLSDPNKRQMYDNGTLNADMNMDVDPFEVFERMRRSWGGFGFAGEDAPRRRGRNIVIKLQLTPEEAYSGGKKVVQIPRRKPCTHCNGTGSEDGQPHYCEHCHGSGYVSVTQKQGYTTYISQTSCSVCGGSGRRIEDVCSHCHGTGSEVDNEEFEVNLPGGLSTGLNIGIPGKGEPSPNGGPNGNLILAIEVVQDESSYFMIDDDRNVLHVENIPFNLAMLGVEREIKCIDGKKVKIKVPELTKDGHSLRLVGKGLPNPNNPKEVGDYYVIVNYEFPKKLNKKQKEMLKNFNN